MKEKEPKYELPLETNPQNAEIGSKTMDKMLNSMWMASGNAVNENKRAGGSGWKHNLRFRISKSCIVLKHLRAVLSEHKSKEDNSFKLPAFLGHSLNSLAIDMFSAEFIYFLCIERTW